MSSLKWFPDDVRHIQRACYEQLGVVRSRQQCVDLWEAFCESFWAAGWMGPSDGDQLVLDLLYAHDVLKEPFRDCFNEAELNLPKRVRYELEAYRANERRRQELS